MRATDMTRVHDDHELAWVAHGWAQFWVDAQTFVADAHHAVWIPRHHEHWLERGDDALVLPIWLTPTPSVEVPASPKLIARNATLDTLVRTCLQPGLVGESRVRDAGLALQQGVAAAAGQVMRASEAAPLPRDPRARRIAQGLLARPWDDRDTDAWAHTEHISGKTLQRLFIEQTGMTFGRWRTVTRMTTAADALRSGRSVAAVAHRSGYGSVASFTTAFSRHHGMPPATYRRAVTDPAALPAQLSTPSATTA